MRAIDHDELPNQDHGVCTLPVSSRRPKNRSRLSSSSSTRWRAFSKSTIATMPSSRVGSCGETGLGDDPEELAVLSQDRVGGVLEGAGAEEVVADEVAQW